MNFFPVYYKQIEFEHLEIACSETGQGNEKNGHLIFLHGLGHSRLAWHKNLAELGEDYHCLALDLPGYGLSSDNPSCTYGMEFYADVVAHFLQEMKLQKVVLIGHSMGGQIALKFALKYPDLLKSLVLCAPAGFEIFQPWEKIIYRNAMMFMDFVLDEEQSLKQVMENSFYQLPESARGYMQKLVEYMHKKDRQRYGKILEQNISGMLNEIVFYQLSDIACPVQIIFGNNDGFIPNRLIHPQSTKSIAEQALRKFPNARLAMIPLCGHFLQWEKSSVVNSLIHEFLK